MKRCLGHPDPIDSDEEIATLYFCPWCGGRTDTPIARTCACGRKFQPAQRGRPQRFCSPRCQARVNMRKPDS